MFSVFRYPYSGTGDEKSQKSWFLYLRCRLEMVAVKENPLSWCRNVRLGVVLVVKLCERDLQQGWGRQANRQQREQRSCLTGGAASRQSGPIVDSLLSQVSVVHHWLMMSLRNHSGQNVAIPFMKLERNLIQLLKKKNIKKDTCRFAEDLFHIYQA